MPEEKPVPKDVKVKFLAVLEDHAAVVASDDTARIALSDTLTRHAHWLVGPVAPVPAETNVADVIVWPGSHTMLPAQNSVPLVRIPVSEVPAQRGIVSSFALVGSHEVSFWLEVDTSTASHDWSYVVKLLPLMVSK